jgi:hypothetical protein
VGQGGTWVRFAVSVGEMLRRVARGGAVLRGRGSVTQGAQRQEGAWLRGAEEPLTPALSHGRWGGRRGGAVGGLGRGSELPARIVGLRIWGWRCAPGMLLVQRSGRGAGICGGFARAGSRTFRKSVLRAARVGRAILACRGRVTAIAGGGNWGSAVSSVFAADGVDVCARELRRCKTSPTGGIGAGGAPGFAKPQARARAARRGSRRGGVEGRVDGGEGGRVEWPS